ncbi:E3 ubiquitin-protein ligase TTC3 isoform X1 [Pangasianodon hypophthalmus]|uniref:E3 ubiquitin-protein ligase TTC3 isoform X1 n=2 Tax=Pangasianodon hypophthalmus TaxID=310915 RepID=UPI0023082406|nr:E3 ubiquitin-protein ligase TTC3 isoform X1 [Pangasianodon hypophthalmus]
MERREMLESEDSDIEEGQDVVRHKTKLIYQDTFPYIHMEPPDIIYERWGKINPDLRREAGHLLHISVFWWHILYRQQDNHSTTAWAVDMGFLDSNVSNDLSLKRLHRIEILELILDTVEKCLAGMDPERKARELIMISMSIRMEDDGLMKAVSWLNESGPPGLSRRILDLGSKQIRHQVLDFVFSEYSRFIQVMSCSRKKMFRELSLNPEQWCLQKSEEMKNKGNEQFQKKKFDLAVKWYTKAIKYHTNNHFLYGNRALCYIRCEKYLKAMGDGKRAILLQRDWAKGHYRFCDALFFLGARDKAVEANITAQGYCSADPEGMRDLQQQYSRFMTEISEGRSKGRACSEAEGKPKKTEAKKGSSKRPEGACGVDHMAQHVHPDKAPEAAHSSDSAENKQKAEDIKQEEPSGKTVTDPQAEDVFKDPESEMGDRKARKKAASGIPEKQSVRNKQPPTQEKPQSSSSSSSEVCSKEQFCAAVRDAHIALSDQRCRNAEQSFSEALRILGSSGTKDLSITELDRTLLIYGYATALIEIGQPEELAEAQRQFEKLSSSANRTFQSLVHYGLGKVLLKENKFSKAKDEFLNALLMVQRQIMPGKLTWPTTKVTVEETCPEYLKEQLERFIETCKFPPKPDAVCRHCLGQAFIYFTDPDFKGFIRLSCCQSCKVEYHINCWKKFKAASFSDKNDKDFLQDLCFTPDCTGTVCRFVIFDSTGLIKCEFKSPISKSKVPGMRVKQKCTSLKKLKSKEERKLRRKQQRLATSVIQNESNSLKIEDKTENGADKGIDQSSFKDCAVYGDRVLHQIDKNRDLFNDESHNISSMLVCLRPWMKLDEDKGHVSILKDRAEPRVLRELVDLLLERKNRVWARVFLHNLSGCQDVKPKVHEWAQQLNNAGLKAAENFIGQFGDELEKLNLSSLLESPPLHDVFSNKGFPLIEYLRQAPPQEMRLFIWTLEEYREHYPSWFTILDDYFEMDAVCLVLKKTEKDDLLSSVYKSKSKNRKKKQKEPKSVLLLSGIRRDEEDDFFFEEDSLMLLDGDDPFSVPDNLREQVAEFEGQYVTSGYLKHYKRFLDNDPDPTKESLYDYFAQILEEHGPLEVSDQLLVGELKNFPPEAQQKIEAAGGLEHFLLESLRFVIYDGIIGLTSHAVCLQHTVDDDAFLLANFPPHTWSKVDSEPKGSSHLNPTAKEFLPQTKHLSLNDSSESYDHATCPVLPSPYVFPPQISQNLNYTFGLQDMPGTVKPGVQEAEYHDYFPDVPLDAFNAEALSSVNNYIHFKEAICHNSKTIFVQTVWGNKDTRDDVAINTEPYAQFEKNRGDMTQTEKNNIKFEKRIQNLKEMLKAFQNERGESCSALEAEVREINQHIEISNKELTLFQQKLEDEVRKDQQEKRDHQEMLKVLKGEIKELVNFQESISKLIQDKNVEYQKELDHFLAVSNQWAAEKMSLEDKIKKYRDLCAKATSRSLAGQVSVLKNRRERGLRGLRKYLSNGKAILKHLTEISPTYPSANLGSITEAWKSFVQEVEEKIVRAETQYEEQIEFVKKGTSLSSLPAVGIPSTPALPLVPAFLQPLSSPQPVFQHAHPHTPYGVQQHPARPQTHMAVNTHHAMHTPPAASENAAAPAPPAASGPVQPPQPLAVFERILDRLSSMFPHYSKSVLTKFIQEVRVMNGGSLSMMKYEEVINRAAQLILDHQEHSQEQMNFASGDVAGVRDLAVPSPTPPSDPPRASATPPPAHVWKSVSSQHRKSSRALNMEDPCIICHDDMTPEDLCVLECRHSFHRECIKSWLKEQSTCPTCREHALLPEDFPMLPGRHRRGHMHAATFS